MIEPIAQGGRHHSGRTIGRRGHDLPAGGILFIDRHGVDAHPIIDRMRGGHIQPALGHQRLMNGFGSAFYIQTTRQNAAPVEPAIDAIVHHLPDFGQAAVKRGSAAAAQLILAFDLGDGFFLSGAKGQQFIGGVEFMEVGVHVAGRYPTGHVLGCHHKTAADGIIGLLQNHIALCIRRHEDHTIGMTRQGWAEVKHDVTGRIEMQCSKPIRADLFVAPHGL